MNKQKNETEVILSLKSKINEYMETNKEMNIERFIRKAGIYRNTLISITKFQEGEEPPNITIKTLFKIKKAMHE